VGGFILKLSPDNFHIGTVGDLLRGFLKKKCWEVGIELFVPVSGNFSSQRGKKNQQEGISDGAGKDLFLFLLRGIEIPRYARNDSIQERV